MFMQNPSISFHSHKSPPGGQEKNLPNAINARTNSRELAIEPPNAISFPPKAVKPTRWAHNIDYFTQDPAITQDPPSGLDPPTRGIAGNPGAEKGWLGL